MIVIPAIEGLTGMRCLHVQDTAQADGILVFSSVIYAPHNLRQDVSSPCLQPTTCETRREATFWSYLVKHSRLSPTS